MAGRAGALASGLWLVAVCAARADPRLDEVVYSPYVEPHTLEVETRFAQELGPGDLAGAHTTVVEFEAGLTDRASLALVTGIERSSGGPDRLTGIGLEGIYYFGQVPKVGVDVAGYLELTKGFGGESDGLEAKLLLAKTQGPFQGLANLIVERPLGAPAGENIARYGYALSATWRAVGHLRLGAEALGDLGDDRSFLGRQGAYVGPQAKWAGRPGRLPFEIVLDAGWLLPVGLDTPEARSQARVNVEFERHF